MLMSRGCGKGRRVTLLLTEVIISCGRLESPDMSMPSFDFVTLGGIGSHTVPGNR